jgi:uncharacterized protein (DUF302 family)
MAYYVKRRVDQDFESTLAATKEALEREELAVLSEIDFEAETCEQFDLDGARRYVVLGVCDAALAERALATEIDLGVLLPCHVAVYVEPGGGTVVSAVDTESLLSLVGHPTLDEIATDVGERLQRALSSL